MAPRVSIRLDPVHAHDNHSFFGFINTKFDRVLQERNAMRKGGNAMLQIKLRNNRYQQMRSRTTVEQQVLQVFDGIAALRTRHGPIHIPICPLLLSGNSVITQPPQNTSNSGNEFDGHYPFTSKPKTINGIHIKKEVVGRSKGKPSQAILGLLLEL